MGVTQVTGKQVLDGTIGRPDLNVATAGQAVIARILEVANTGIKINASSGADTGTGDVSLKVDTTYLDTLYARKDSITGQRLWGRYTGTAGALQEISIGTGLNLNASTGVLSLASHTHDYATHRSEGTNYVDYSRYVYNNGAYSGTGWVEPSDLGVRYAGSAGAVNWNGVSNKPTRADWTTDNRAISVTVGQLAWKHYGNNHTIFDASNSTSPSGGAVNNTNAAVAWSATYPTLMGWNGSNTYGVRVDSARVADSAGAVAWGNVSGKPFNWSGQSGQPTWLWGSNDGSNYYVWNPSNFSVNYAGSAGAVAWSGISSKPTTLSGYGITDSLYQASVGTLDVNAFNSTGLYRGSSGSWANRPTTTHNGSALLQIDTHPGNYHQQLFFDTGGNQLRMRSANAGTWGSWVEFLHSGNWTSYSPTLTGTGASGTWGINISGSSAGCSGNAASATKLQTARTIALSGAVTGSIGFDGTANINIGCTIGSNLSLTGVPLAPTAPVGTNTTQIATTAFVISQVNNAVPAATEATAGIVKLATESEVTFLTNLSSAVTPGQLAAAFQGSKNLNGYIKFPNGVIIQWGQSTATTGTTVYYPISFPNYCRSVVATAGDGLLQIETVAYNSFYWHDATNNVTTAWPVKWIAIGY